MCLSVDPLAEQFPGWNPYHYVHNNPINLIDPTGMSAETYDQDPPKRDTSNDIIVSLPPSSPQQGYPGQGLDEVITGGIQWLGSLIIGSDVSEETSGNIQLATTLAIIVVSKGKNVKAVDVAKTEKKAVGSYTIGFESGKKYHGKGTETRMNKSANDKSKTYNDPVKSKDFTKAKNDREAFKQESRRIDTDKVGNTPGHKNPNNYNKRASPGEKYRKQDNN